MNGLMNIIRIQIIDRHYKKSCCPFMPIQGGHGRHPTTAVDTIKHTRTANNTWDAWECTEMQRLKVTCSFSKFIVLGCVCVGIHKVGILLSVDNLWVSVFSLDYVGPEVWTQLFRLGSKCPYWLSHLSHTTTIFLCLDFAKHRGFWGKRSNIKVTV